MKTIQTQDELRDVVRQWRKAGEKIAFVPTMGNLHAGHLSLVEHARSLADRVVVSIFVNPLQFNEASDFANYPKTLDEDQQKLQEQRLDLLFLPDERLMYPQGQPQVSKVQVPEITEMLEGASRPGHFDGVATVVLKLFNLVQPDLAVFGEKDYQQLLVVKKMVADFNLPIDIHSVPTCREEDGLAMSSRNIRLTLEQRRLAPELYRILLQVREQVIEFNTDIKNIEDAAMAALSSTGFTPEYVSVRQAENLGEVTDDTRERRLLAAVRLGDVRLIDNIAID